MPARSEILITETSAITHHLNHPPRRIYGVVNKENWKNPRNAQRQHVKTLFRDQGSHKIWWGCTKSVMTVADTW